MKGKVALLALAILALTAGSGNKKAYYHVTSTGAIVGNGTGLLPKRTALSIAEIASGAGTISEFIIWSTQGLESSPDTIALGNGVALNEYFNGSQVDSLYCLTLASGSEFIVAVDNKP